MKDNKGIVSRVRKSAVVGITGIKRLFFEMYVLVNHSHLRAFGDKESAMKYLTTEKQP